MKVIEIETILFYCKGKEVSSYEIVPRNIKNAKWIYKKGQLWNLKRKEKSEKQEVVIMTKAWVSGWQSLYKWALQGPLSVAHYHMLVAQLIAVGELLPPFPFPFFVLFLEVSFFSTLFPLSKSFFFSHATKNLKVEKRKLRHKNGVPSQF